MFTTIDEAKRQALADAEEVRQQFGTIGFPVDPVQIARNLGIDVRLADFPPDVAGVFVKRPGHDPIIGVEKRDSVNRQRFTVAHELAHFILTFSEDDVERVDKRDQVSTQGTEPVEVYANTFAAELLMPKDEVTRLHNKGLPPLAMAKVFGVSDQAMTFRLDNLGYSVGSGVPAIAAN